MKFLFSCLFAISPFLILAQPSWSSIDEPSIGDSTYYYVIDSNATNLSSTKGPNVSWNYSNITTYSFDKTLRSAAENAPSNIYGSFYPSASHDEYVDEQFHNFYRISTTGRVNSGFDYKEHVQNFNALIIYDEIESRTYPFAYPDKKTGSFSNGKVVLYPNTIQQLNLDAFGSYSIEADAYGTLTLIDSVIPDVLRINTRDSVFADVAILGTTMTLIRNQYEYIQDGNPFPVFVHSDVRLYGSLFNKDFTLVLSHLKPNISTGISINSDKEKIMIHPNPARENINIKASSMKILSVDLFDIHGNKMISLGRINQSELIQMNIESLATGMYFVKLNSESGNYHIKKLMVK